MERRGYDCCECVIGELLREFVDDKRFANLVTQISEKIDHALILFSSNHLLFSIGIQYFQT